MQVRLSMLYGEGNSFVVTYDANGGTNAPASQTKTYGVSLTLSSSVPTRERIINLLAGVLQAHRQQLPISLVDNIPQMQV